MKQDHLLLFGQLDQMEMMVIYQNLILMVMEVNMDQELSTFLEFIQKQMVLHGQAQMVDLHYLGLLIQH